MGSCGHSAVGWGGLGRGMGGLGGCSRWSVGKRPGWTQGPTIVGKEMALGQAWLAGDGISTPTSPLHPQHPYPSTCYTPYTRLAPLKLEQPPALHPQHFHPLRTHSLPWAPPCTPQPTALLPGGHVCPTVGRNNPPSPPQCHSNVLMVSPGTGWVAQGCGCDMWPCHPL